jgi:hypothetical protein
MFLSANRYPLCRDMCEASSAQFVERDRSHDASVGIDDLDRPASPWAGVVRSGPALLDDFFDCARHHRLLAQLKSDAIPDPYVSVDQMEVIEATHHRKRIDPCIAQARYMLGNLLRTCAHPYGAEADGFPAALLRGLAMSEQGGLASIRQKIASGCQVAAGDMRSVTRRASSVRTRASLGVVPLQRLNAWVNALTS